MQRPTTASVLRNACKAGFALVTLALLASCDRAQLLDPTHSPAGANRDVTVSTDVGTVVVTVTYLGQPVSASGAAVNLPYANVSSSSVNYNFRDQINVPAGTYTLSLGGWAPAVTITVAGGQTVQQNFEVSGTVGIATGKVTVNGGVPPSGFGICAASSCGGFAADGGFKLMLPAGGANAFVWGNGCQCYTMKRFTVDVTAGQTSDAGTIDVGIGSVTTSVTYLGQPLSSLGVAFNGPYSNVSGNGVNFSFTGHIDGVPAGTYTLSYGSLATPVTITIDPGQTVTHTFEISDHVGLVSGKVLVNGATPPSGYGVCVSGTCGGFAADGGFKLLVPSGSANGIVWGNGCQCYTLKTFALNVAAGQTTDAGTIQLGTGSVQVDVVYQGQALSSVGAGFNAPYANVSGNGISFSFSGRIDGVPEGTYTLSYGSLATPVTITVTGGGTVTHTFDITPKVGMLVGKALINSAPPPSGYGVCAAGSCGGFAADGSFKLLIPVGKGSGFVWGNGCQCYVIATFQYDITDGGTTVDVGNPLQTDNTPPVITPNVSGQAGANGWYTGDVSVSWTVTDAESPISSKSGCDASSVTSNTAGVTFTCTAQSGGGTATKSVTIKRDATPPVLTPSISGTAGDNGWYRSDVTVTWNASDDISGISAGCAANTLSTDNAGTTYTCTVTNGAGLRANASRTVKRDATPPTVTFSGNAGAYTVDQQIAITCSAADAMSGVASSTCAPVSGDAYAFTLGANTVSASAMDHAGNSGSGTTSFTVSVTSASLCKLVQRFSTNAGVANSLCAKLSNTAYGAFRNEVQAQTGKMISASDAAVLLRLVDALAG